MASRRPLRLLLLNPNTDRSVTASMLALAREFAPDGTVIEGATATSGAKLITNKDDLAAAANAIVTLFHAEGASGYDGTIVAAFGDPGLEVLRLTSPRPVTGTAEAGMAEAALHGPFVVVTTTPDLVASITDAALRYGHRDRFRGVRVTPGLPREIMANTGRLHAALRAACMDAVREDGAAAVVIGGGPLAAEARKLRSLVPVPVIEPIPAAVRLAVART